MLTPDAGDLEVGVAITWIVRISAWMRWQDAQRVADNDERLIETIKLHLAESVFRARAEDGKILVRGRRSGKLQYEDISPDFWKSVYLDIQPDKKTLWRVRVIARDGLDREAAKQIPDYKSLLVSEQRVYELWPRKDAELDALTRSLLTKASRNEPR